MRIGDKVTSKLYAEKGIGTILGFTDLFNMSGGFNAWSGAGHPTTTAVNSHLLSVSDTMINFVDVVSLLFRHLFW